jgi:hypothetical protein
MNDSVIIRDVSRHEVEETVAAPDVSMSVSLVVYDEELSYAEENNDADDYNYNGDDDGNNDIDDDAEDKKKFATPTSKQGLLLVRRLTMMSTIETSGHSLWSIFHRLQLIL